VALAIQGFSVRNEHSNDARQTSHKNHSGDLRFGTLKVRYSSLKKDINFMAKKTSTDAKDGSFNNLLAEGQ
jgi:hypothetical protein